jgi:hypothetical protein
MPEGAALSEQIAFASDGFEARAERLFSGAPGDPLGIAHGSLNRYGSLWVSRT